MSCCLAELASGAVLTLRFSHMKSQDRLHRQWMDRRTVREFSFTQSPKKTVDRSILRLAATPGSPLAATRS